MTHDSKGSGTVRPGLQDPARSDAPTKASGLSHCSVPACLRVADLFAVSLQCFGRCFACSLNEILELRMVVAALSVAPLPKKCADVANQRRVKEERSAPPIYSESGCYDVESWIPLHSSSQRPKLGEFLEPGSPSRSSTRGGAAGRPFLTK
jgi:hypothetical protein